MATSHDGPASASGSPMAGSGHRSPRTQGTGRRPTRRRTTDAHESVPSRVAAWVAAVLVTVFVVLGVYAMFTHQTHPANWRHFPRAAREPVR